MVWNSASETQKRVFVGGLSAMAINAGPAGARDIVNHLKGKSFSSLDAYSQGLPGAARIQYNGAKETNTSRGAIKGIDTVQELMKR